MVTGELLSFLQVDRELRVISALHRARFPVPAPLLHCSDAGVIGTEFYIMECVKVWPSLSSLCTIFASLPSLLIG